MGMTDREHDIALMEAAEADAVDRYFDARPSHGSEYGLRRIFEAGFRRGWQASQAVDGQCGEVSARSPQATDGDEPANRTNEIEELK